MYSIISGIYKPWFKNRLHKELWEKYNILSLSKDYEIHTKKGKIKTNMNICLKKEYTIDTNYFPVENIFECEKYLNAINKSVLMVKFIIYYFVLM